MQRFSSVVSLLGSVACLALFAAPGCSGPSAGNDASSSPIDTGVHDAGQVIDAGHDAAAADDASVGDDAGDDASMDDVGFVARDAAGPDSGVPCDPTTDCGLGYYCHTHDGVCDGSGVCEVMVADAFCPGTDIVCGCNGFDYVNPCAAARDGIAIDHYGTCDGNPGCTEDLDCPALPGLHGIRFCQYADGACGGTGVCTSRLAGVLCTLTCVPQCGCDGVSYRNECDRRQGGTSLMARDNCPLGPPACSVGGACCTASTDCAVGQTCAIASDASGRCEGIAALPGCWNDTDCGDPTMHCVGAFVCPCGMTCSTATAPGTCG